VFRRLPGGSEGVGSRFHVLRSRTLFRRYRGRRVPCSCFACLNSFSAVPRASGPVFMFCAPILVFAGTGASDPVFMFCAPGLIFGCTRGVGSHFLVLRARNHFPRFRGRRFPFSCLARSYSFSQVPRALGPIFMFCASGLVFGGSEGGCRFHGLRTQTRFQRYRGRRVPFSCFALPDLFSELL
jgi:hypothetical protein